MFEEERQIQDAIYIDTWQITKTKYDKLNTIKCFEGKIILFEMKDERNYGTIPRTLIYWSLKGMKLKEVISNFEQMIKKI